MLRTWTLCRGPLFVAFVLGCVASLIATGMLTLRIVVPAAMYWSYVPVTEVLVLAAVTWRRRRLVPFPIAVDTFFAGHAAWTLFLILVAAMLAFLPPEFGWGRLKLLLYAGIGVIAWSAYVDFRFFRSIFRASRAAAARDVVVSRLLTWTIVFAVFAVHGTSPWGVAQEIVEAVHELFQ